MPCDTNATRRYAHVEQVIPAHVVPSGRMLMQGLSIALTQFLANPIGLAGLPIRDLSIISRNPPCTGCSGNSWRDGSKRAAAIARCVEPTKSARSRFWRSCHVNCLMPGFSAEARLFHLRFGLRQYAIRDSRAVVQLGEFEIAFRTFIRALTRPASRKR